MTQGELEGIPVEIEKAFSELENRILSDIVRRIKINGFSTASADWQITRLQQLGRSEEEIKEWIQDALDVSDHELERIFSDTVYEEYYGHERAYTAHGRRQKPLEDNEEMQKLIKAVKIQTAATFRNMTASMGFALQDPSGKLDYTELREFYQKTLDTAIMDIQSGAFSYQEVLERTINTMTKSGIRWVDYESGHHNRIDVAARRAVMTGFRQVQEKINEQVAADLGTDTYEVTYHVGARPTHQPWQGRVWTMEQLISVCGLGTVTGLHGANCYHDYNAFIPGVSVRTYTDEQLDRMITEENRKKEYNGKEYTTYEALQQQRKMETAMRKIRRDIQLMQEGESDKDALTLKKAKYQGQMQTYKDFSKKMGLPEQLERVKVYKTNIVHADSKIPDNNSGKHRMFALSPKKRAEMAVAISKKYTARDSKWSGTIIIDDSKCKQEKISGRKEWSCDILVSSKAGPKTYIHEVLHSRSASYLNRLSYARYAQMEEASVEFLARKICEAEGIDFKVVPNNGVQALERINSIAKIREDDMSFAVALFVRDLKDRYKWLETEVDKHIKRSPADTQQLLTLLDSLKGMKR